MLYDKTKVTYFDVGEKKFEALYRDMENAKKFIFLEYYIIKDGQVWQRIKEIAARKVQEGVEVRLLYDDFGSLVINTLNSEMNWQPLAYASACFLQSIKKQHV